MIPTKIVKDCQILRLDSYGFLLSQLICIKKQFLLGRTIAFDFLLALVNDKATPTVVVIMTNQKNSLVKEYFSNWDNCL
jgi:hypothetical protein